jgi:hypothetical protein
MRKPELDIKTFSEVMTAVDHYNSLPNYFTQLDQSQKETLTAFWNELYGNNWKREMADYENWKRPNIHIVMQSWSNGACGWGGIGPAAITSNWTVVIENIHAGFFAVYWDGRLAYIAKLDELSTRYSTAGYRSLPALNHVQDQLTVIYQYKPFNK